MRLVSFTTDGNPLRAGLDTPDGIIELAAVAALVGYPSRAQIDFRDTRKAIAHGSVALGELERASGLHLEKLREDGSLHERDTVRLGPPIPDPQKIICLGLNYRDHAAELRLAEPAAPMFFAKYANSLTGPSDPIVPPPHTEQVDYEAELAVVIGRSGRHIPREEALDHVIGAMAFNDVSARDLQMANNLWTGGKAIDTFAPCGPALVTLDEIEDLQALALHARVNGETVQSGTTASMIFGVAETIAFLSQIMTLEPGDIIATGTPAGVGNSRDPKLFLRNGDIVEVEIEGLGMLRNQVTQAG